MSILRGLARTIISQFWSHFSRFALINYQIKNYSRMKISDLISDNIHIIQFECQVFGILEFQLLPIDLNIGKEIAYTSLNNT